MTNNHLKRLGASLLGLVCLLASLAVAVAASSLAAADDAPAFSVAPVMPSNQANKSEGYFDLTLAPGSRQSLEVKLINQTDHAIRVDTAFATATTADSGIPVYVPVDKPVDSSLHIDISKFVSLPSRVELPARAVVTVKAQVTMPSQAFQGVIAGGLSFKQAPDAGKVGDQTSSQGTGVSVINEYRYVVALVMRQSAAIVSPDLRLGAVGPAQVNNRNVITANLQNTAMAYLNQMNVTATVTGLSDPSVRYSLSNPSMQMAPNSNFNLTIPVSIQGPLGDKTSTPLAAGRYRLNMTVFGDKSDQGTYQTDVNGSSTRYLYRWVFSRDFEVSAQKAASLNASDPTIAHPGPDMWMIIVIIMLALIVLGLIALLIILLLKRRKKDDEAQAVAVPAGMAPAAPTEAGPVAPTGVGPAVPAGAGQAVPAGMVQPGNPELGSPLDGQPGIQVVGEGGTPPILND